MGSERSLWHTIAKNMKDKWEADRVENPASPGTPDIYYTLYTGEMGWLELKYAHAWPSRPLTPLRLDHFTNKQKSFIRRHGSRGALVYLLLQVDRDYLLFTWETALRLGELNKTECLDLAFHWKSRINYNDLCEKLRKNTKN